MPRSRPDLMALLDVILLVFFAMTLNKDKKHQQERNVLVKKISRQVQKTAGVQKKLKHERGRYISLEKQLRSFKDRREKIYHLVSDLQSLVFLMNGKSQKKEQTSQPIRRQLLKMRALLQRTAAQLTAERKFLVKANQKLAKQFQVKRLELEKLQLKVRGLRESWGKERVRSQRKQKSIMAKNKRLQESRKQLEASLRLVQRWGRMSGREKSGLTESLARYFQAVMIYVKADRIVGYRRFPNKKMKAFSRTIELSRRSSNGINLYYRGKIKKDFRAFEILKRKLPAELSSSPEVIYIFIFDDNCSKAITQGLEHEHLKYYRGRRVIWQL